MPSPLGICTPRGSSLVRLGLIWEVKRVWELGRWSTRRFPCEEAFSFTLSSSIPTLQTATSVLNNPAEVVTRGGTRLLIMSLQRAQKPVLGASQAWWSCTPSLSLTAFLEKPWANAPTYVALGKCAPSISVDLSCQVLGKFLLQWWTDNSILMWTISCW